MVKNNELQEIANKLQLTFSFIITCLSNFCFEIPDYLYTRLTVRPIKCNPIKCNPIKCMGFETSTGYIMYIS